MSHVAESARLGHRLAWAGRCSEQPGVARLGVSGAQGQGVVVARYGEPAVRGQHLQWSSDVSASTIQQHRSASCARRDGYGSVTLELVWFGLSLSSMH